MKSEGFAKAKLIYHVSFTMGTFQGFMLKGKKKRKKGKKRKKAQCGMFQNLQL